MVRQRGSGAVETRCFEEEEGGDDDNDDNILKKRTVHHGWFLGCRVGKG